MPNYSYLCGTCESITIHNAPYETRPTEVVCACGGEAKYTIDSPMVMRASYPDGTKRKGFAELREANKLTKEKYQTRNKETAAEITREIKKMGVKVEK